MGSRAAEYGWVKTLILKFEFANFGCVWKRGKKDQIDVDRTYAQEYQMWRTSSLSYVCISRHLPLWLVSCITWCVHIGYAHSLILVKPKDRTFCDIIPHFWTDTEKLIQFGISNDNKIFPQNFEYQILKKKTCILWCGQTMTWISFLLHPASLLRINFFTLKHLNTFYLISLFPFYFLCFLRIFETRKSTTWIGKQDMRSDIS